ncbi:type III-A CRISPR-associated RAMP protein Csm4 [Methanotorris formicicus]|uniref:CRISPR system Cms protein Csm4 n=1 Tax=Methanotorris formicicus Mc-S-70 TaxID=647171 RepID=H1KYS8_9EURY|nr:type III-A CRISPR-associated RAMP protein Csm4 [Methanotorris formicicus]EHP86825.1 CRISPR-associated RAMP protein, Csm4 family [Methanotorris formicicus Mc-S-70]
MEESSLIFHSHSLFSAIVNNFVKLYGEFDKSLLNLRVSSLFPKFKDIYFIPKPETPFFNIPKGKDAKKIKKIKFISLEAFEEYLNGEYLNEQNMKNIKNQIIGKEFLIGMEEIDSVEKYSENLDEIKLISKEIEQKIAMDRIKNITLEKDGRGQLYNVEFIRLNYGTEFYFLVDYGELDEDLIKKINASIKLIEDEGLGGKRSIGAGFFESVVIGELNEKFNELFDREEDYHLTLSTAIPRNGNVEYYKLIEIGGYIYSIKGPTCLKKRILALTEGSIVKKGFVGKIENLEPENYVKHLNHHVYVNGKPILMPTKVY